MKRERAAQTLQGPVEETFWAPSLIGLSTVETLAAQNINVTIMHNFGLINNEPFHHFLGMDFGATVRLGLDYGLTSRWSVGAGRTSPHKQYDFRSTYRLLEQTKTDEIPVSIAIKGDIGIDTNKNGYKFSDRLNYFSSLMVARKFSDQFSLQVAPLYTHFNRVFAGEEKGHFAIGVGAEYHLSDRLAIMAEYFPVLGNRSAGTTDAFALGLNIETGGHVFQLFLKSSNWHTEQHIIAQNNDDFWAGDIRFGFNVNRIFWTGEKRE
ncbi:DUF5777 family beta-barrel protein [Halalkalibaculum sp. DA384]|uniref:DUF5777 family beta-barrel protein n=1 Tax=Halalkalibaculum sp. DA384 TaxID=3373606 RepID=UPI003754860D